MPLDFGLRAVIIADAGENLPPEALPIVLAVILVAAISMLVCLFLFLRLGGLWLQGFLSGAHVPLPVLIGMSLRRSPTRDIVRWRIMVVQAGVDISIRQLESAYLQGADVELAVLAMIHGRDSGKPCVWDEVIRADTAERLRRKLDEG